MLSSSSSSWARRASSTAATASTSVSASPSLRAVASAFSTPPAETALELSLYDSSILPLLPPSPPPPFDLASLELVATQLRAKLRLDLELDLDDLDLSGVDLGLGLSGLPSDAASLADGGDDAGYTSDDEEEGALKHVLPQAVPSAGSASAAQGAGAGAGLASSASDGSMRDDEGSWVTSGAPRHRQRKRPPTGASVVAGIAPAPTPAQRSAAQPPLPPRRQQQQQQQQQNNPDDAS
jgi:hypothetical protein